MSFDLKDPRNQKIALLGVVFIFFIYLWYAHLYSPGAEKIKEKKAQYRLKVGELAQLQAQAAPLEEIRKEYQQLTTMLKSLEQLLPEQEYLVQFLKLLHDAAQTHNLLLREVTPVASSLQGETVANNFKVVVEGTYHDFGRFLARVANFPFMVRVSRMNLKSPVKTKAQEGGEERTIVASFLITTYNANNANSGSS